ncbi:MAG TPA: PfkB family carbohydrate kinase [Segeticoccus sp.]|uniref:carbohydrate kinase family protein n=1 Tax=Segeticoccus sp. TaxID=2706531 RepID=UPI002D7F6632|nr:PfkB family carbohydrate kinase [Segeticoccus sp.]HET8599146.1 PfkB family carbohydrate kinase [Segeticoccus sp.]
MTARDTTTTAKAADAERQFDVFVHGTVFLDIIFTGLGSLPTGGTEIWAEGMGSCPGGIANLAVATGRLGLSTSLAAAFGDDDYGDFCWRTLEQQEGIDLSHSRRFEHWHSPVTVSMATPGDRAMVTHGHAPPVPVAELIGTPPRARAAIVDLSESHPIHVAGTGAGPGDGAATATWVDAARANGTKIFADVGWDPSGQWSPAILDQLSVCHAFMPNATEAMAYTRCGNAKDALYTLADLVPLAVVTNGAEGAMAIDSETGEEAHVPAVRVKALDATGAGDVFGAAIVLGTLKGWPLANRLAFAGVCSALAVQQFGGSLAAPGWGDISDWWSCTKGVGPTDAYHASLLRRYAFLDDVTPPAPLASVRRAQATVARLADIDHTDAAPQRHTRIPPHRGPRSR